MNRAAERPDLVRRGLFAIACGTSFFVLYNFTNWVAASRDIRQTCYSDWELDIPLIPWLILPYWSIDLLFVIAFLICRTGEELGRLARRILLAIAIASIAFLVWPIRLGWEREVDLQITGAWRPLFDTLFSFDQPFNLFPSLHVAFCVLLHGHFLSHARHPLLRNLIHAWFMLITLSTVFVHQHHLIDVLGGLLLGGVCCYLFTTSEARWHRSTTSKRTWQLTALYSLGAITLALAAASFGGWWLLLLWPSLSCALVAFGYAGAGSRVCPSTIDGPTWPAKFLLFPWLEALGQSRRWYWRRLPPPAPIHDGIHIGNVRDAENWNGAVVDASCEHRRRGSAARFQRVPLLDLTAPTPDDLQAIARLIDQQRRHGPVLVCCGLGLGRSVLLVAAWLLSTGRAANPDHAMRLIRRTRPGAVLPADGRAALGEIVTHQMKEHRCREGQRVHPIQNTSMAAEDPPEILDAGIAFDG